MKKSTLALVVLLGLCGSLAAFAVPQVAVLDTVLAAGVDPAAGTLVTSKLEEEFVNRKAYKVLDRANVERVLREKEFQLSSGIVKNEEIRQAGEYLGADLVVVANVSRIGQTYVISAKMIDVATGEIAAQASAERSGKIDLLLEIAREVGARLAGAQVVVAVKAEPAAAPEPKAEKPKVEAATAAAGPAAAQAQALIKKKAHMKPAGQLQLMGLADQLTESERMFLYTTNTKDNAVVALLLNLLLTSLGSFVQGDVSGGLTELSLAVSGAVMMSFGYSEYYDYYYGYWYSEPNALFYVGVAVLITDVVYMCVRPFGFQKRWNANLARSLKTLELSFLDEQGVGFEVVPSPQGPQWKLGLELVSFKY